MGRPIDLNADVGEGFGAWRSGDDEALLDLVTSANVACGFHAGDAATMRRTCAAARERGVRIGAHVGFPDLAGFGRREMGLSAAEIADAVIYQLGALRGCAGSVGARVSYLKPHGALYHRVSEDGSAAAAVAEAVRAVDPELAVLGPPGSRLLASAAALGLSYVTEGFADRAYGEDRRLLDRRRPGSELDPRGAADQAVALATGAAVRTTSGGAIELEVRSICLHGDGQRALETARAVVSALGTADVELRPFA
jgi:5-oxoprolinase (ATP-hydrolysing) subunit A